MATLVIGIGGTGRKVLTSSSRKEHRVYCSLCFDSSEPMANDRHKTAQKIGKTEIFGVDEKLSVRWADAPKNEFCRIQEQQLRNQYRSHVNAIRELLHQVNQKLDTRKKDWRDQIGTFRRAYESNRNLFRVADQYKRNFGLFLEIQDRAKTARYDRNRILYRLKNDWSETVNQSILEQRLRRLLQLQNQQWATPGREVSPWHDTILCNDGICRKTDRTKVCIRDRSQLLILPNHMSKLFAFYPRLQTIDGNEQISVMPAA